MKMDKHGDDERQCRRRRAMERMLLRRGHKAEWYVLRVAPQKEFVIERLLWQQGLLAYVPARYEWRRVSRFRRTKQQVLRPVLIRYVLVGFRQPARWLDLFHNSAIESVIGFDGSPCRVQWSEIDRMLRHYHGGVAAPAEQKYMRSNKEFAIGDVARIADGGVFDGLSARVEDIRGRRAKMLVDFMGGPHAFDVPLDKLEAA